MVDVIESARRDNPAQVNRLHMRERSITAYLAAAAAAARLQSSSIIICHAVADLTPDIPAIMDQQTRPLSSSCDLLTGCCLNGLTQGPARPSDPDLDISLR